LLAAQLYATPGLTWLDGLAVPVWVIGFVIEAMGDWQLAHFKANPANRGKVMNQGVWRYTRHPNYFGDAAQWWGYYLIAASAGGWWTILSPMIMTTLWCASPAWRWKRR
jgi:steroid 5-alpha reductase family enzyme